MGMQLTTTCASSMKSGDMQETFPTGLVLCSDNQSIFCLNNTSVQAHTLWEPRAFATVQLSSGSVSSLVTHSPVLGCDAAVMMFPDTARVRLKRGVRGDCPGDGRRGLLHGWPIMPPEERPTPGIDLGAMCGHTFMPCGLTIDDARGEYVPPKPAAGSMVSTWLNLMRLEVSPTPTGLKGAPAPGHTGYGAELRWSQIVLSTAGPFANALWFQRGNVTDL